MSHSVTDSSVVVPRNPSMAWIVCLSAGLFFMYEFFQLNIFDVINQPLRNAFNINATQLSWMSSMYLWADILFLLPAGLILDRFSTRKVIITALLVCVLGTIGFAITDSFILASFFHFLSGIGNAFCFLSCVVLVSRWFPPKRQGLVIGSIVTMAFLGGMLAHTPFALLYDLFGWRRALLIDGAVGACLLIWIYFMVKDHPVGFVEAQLHAEENVIAGFKKASTNIQNWLAGLFTSLLNLPILVLCALWGASYLQIVHHLPEMTASSVISLIFVGSAIGCPLVGWLSDLQGRRKPLMIAGALVTFVIVLPLIMNIHLSQWTLSILFFALGFVTSTQVISYPLVAESNPIQNTGSAMGMACIIIMGGGGVAQVIFGWLITHHAGSSLSTYTSADFQFAMWMFPIAAVVALISVLLSKETFCKRLGE